MGQKPLRLAVIIDHIIETGGGFQQALNSSLMINKKAKDICEPIFIVLHKSNIKVLKEYKLYAVYLKISLFTKLILLLKSKIHFPDNMSWMNSIFLVNSLEKFFRKLNIDLIYFTSPSALPKYIFSYNFIYTLWDLSHRDDVEFPEIRENFVFERREARYETILPKATTILVDSEVGASNVVRRYGVDKDRVLVMPFSPAENSYITDMDYNNNFIDIKKKYNISTDYVFYPAQFWSHKNHVYILRGIKYLEKSYGVQLSAIFAGSDKGNKSHVLKVVNNLGLANRVIFTGFVSNEEMPYLYRQAFALTMPSYFGPTNLPPMEAFQLGVPVIYGDINGAKEQLGDAAILVDLKNEITFANALISLQDKSLRKKMIDKGHKQLEYINSKRDIADSTFKSILCEYKIRRQSWGK